MALSHKQLQQISPEELESYEALDAEGKAQFEYFYGFTSIDGDDYIVTNEEILRYQEAAGSIKMKTIAQMLNFVPHKGQQPFFYSFDAQDDLYNAFVLLFGRRTGKSEVVSVAVTREMFLPHSSTILLTPVFENAKIIFQNVLKKINQLGMPIKSINRGSFKIELANGARFSANSAANVEAALGSSNSLVVVDETQSIPGIRRILNMLLVPTLLDYGTRESGILWAHQILIGTPRGEENELTDYYYNELTMANWKSFRAPSTTNPTLPVEYVENMRLELGDMIYRQEILAEIIGSDRNVFYGFKKDRNVYTDEDFVGNQASLFINGIDIGWSDSTANLAIYRSAKGSYYVAQAYSQNQTTTEQHVKNYREMEAKMKGECDIRYCDPAAAQTINDYIETYDYDVTAAKNDVMTSIEYINNLLEPTGVNKLPRLYIHESLGELQRQILRIRFKPTIAGKKAKDPFIPDPEGTHWDMIAALRYALYSDQFNMGSVNIITSGR